MTRMEEARALRDRTDKHFNCCQSILVPFRDVCSMDEETAYRLGTSFGGGVRCGIPAPLAVEEAAAALRFAWDLSKAVLWPAAR